MNDQNIDIDGVLNSFNDLTTKPEQFLTTEEPFQTKIAQLIKSTYDLLKLKEKQSCSSALPELITRGFDSEQIWQQIELQNDDFLTNSITGIGRFVVEKERLLFDNLKSKELQNDLEEDNSEEETENQQEDEVEPSLSEEEIVRPQDEANESHTSEEGEASDDDTQNGKRNKRPSVVDDEFFKLDEMNKFLLSEEKKLDKPKIKSTENESDSDESIDYFAEGSDMSYDEDDQEESKMKNPRYKDFFRSEQEAAQKSVHFLQNEEESDDSDKPIEENHQKETIKSSLELRNERLNRKIDEIEETAVSEKPWQLKGEVSGERRPQNSLLEEILEFDISSRPAPVITQETTQILEDVIKQRIKDKAFDDVERKEKPVDTPYEFRKRLLLNEEKSKESLAQIYEKEFIEKREAQNADEEKEEEEPALHKQVKTLMYNLFRKLDALSNFHFTPKPVIPELKVINNLPAISMEEVAPVAISDAALLAPEEVKRKLKGDVIGKSERSSTDKNRERRKKKLKQKIHAEIAKKKPVKEKVKKVNIADKKLKSSTAFFEQLQDEVKSQIKSKGKERRSKDEHAFNAKKMKL